MAKETFVRTKPHVNIGTIGHGKLIIAGDRTGRPVILCLLGRIIEDIIASVSAETLYRLKPTRFPGEPTKVPPDTPSFTYCQ